MSMTSHTLTLILQILDIWDIYIIETKYTIATTMFTTGISFPVLDHSISLNVMFNLTVKTIESLDMNSVLELFQISQQKKINL